MDSTRTRRLLAVALLLTVGACRSDERDVRWRGLPIFGGSPDTIPAHQAVVALTYSSGEFFCSGTLIAPDVVLTAAHCLQGQHPSNTRVFFGNDVDGPGSLVTVSEILQHPDYTNSEDDIGLVRLTSPSTVAPIPALPASSMLTVGMDLDFSGFGQTESGGSGVKLHVIGPLGLVCDGASSCDFAGNWVTPRSIAYDQADGGPCFGDSGGPAFATVGGVEYVAGVTSYGDENCTVYGVSTLASSYATWINDFIGNPIEICGLAGDEDGDGLSDCDDPDCAAAPVCLPNACDGAATIGCGGSIGGDTTGGMSIFQGNSCLTSGVESGPEVAYLLTAGLGAEVTVTLEVPENDLDLFVFGAAGDTCNPDTCVAASFEPAGTNETATFIMPAAAYIVVETYDVASAYTLTVSCSATAEDCDNAADDDGDGAADCADSDCAADPACAAVEICGNSIDDDGDGAADCDDSDCAADPGCVGVENCTNSTDDDGDGAADCDDPDCATAPACEGLVEVCDNTTDDDGDGAVDCADPDCASAASCGTNDDGDGDGGCGCRTSGSSGRSPLLALLTLALALLLRLPLRRRSRT